MLINHLILHEDPALCCGYVSTYEEFMRVQSTGRNIKRCRVPANTTIPESVTPYPKAPWQQTRVLVHQGQCTGTLT